MNGTGTDIWGTGDQCRFAYKQLKGNGTIIAKVESVTNTNGWAKAGVMIREGMDAGSANAMVAVTPSNGVSFQQRVLGGDVSTNTAVTGPAAPTWVKLARSGNTFTAQYSGDGITWSDIAVSPAVTVPMTGDVFIGLAVTSHAAGVTCGAKFSSVSTTGSVSGQWQTADLGVPQASGNAPEAFYVALEDSSGKSKGVSNPDKTVIATGAWQQWDIPLSQFTSAGVNLAAIKKMVIGVGDRAAPQAGSAGKLYIDDIRLTRIAAP
jgi:regulation of enolase protein 1 (concanavalin A-like superfamily)